MEILYKTKKSNGLIGEPCRTPRLTLHNDERLLPTSTSYGRLNFYI